MEEGMAARYWCHMCSQMVNPIMEVEIKCPFCQGGFVEEMNNTRGSEDHDSEFGSDRALSLWAPILLGMMGNRRHRRRLRRREFEDYDGDHSGSERRHGLDSELDRELESIIRRRRRSSETILHLLQGIRAGIASESENSENGRDRERERVIIINPFNQNVIVQGSALGSNQHQNTIGSLSDYLIGPGLDLLLQHLAENDPNRYGTPPAQKEAVEAMPTVEIEENLQCSVCLDDFDIGAEAKEMPCKHKFHSGCILPWLEVHSTCPVCRFQLPADESKRDLGASRDASNHGESDTGNASASNQGESDPGNGTDEDGGRDGSNESGRRFSIPWPFSGLFSSAESQSGEENSSSTSSYSSR